MSAFLVRLLFDCRVYEMYMKWRSVLDTIAERLRGGDASFSIHSFLRTYTTLEGTGSKIKTIRKMTYRIYPPLSLFS